MIARHCYPRPTGWHSGAASALGKAFKIALISRAQRSTAMPCWVANTANDVYQAENTPLRGVLRHDSRTNRSTDPSADVVCCIRVLHAGNGIAAPDSGIPTALVRLPVTFIIPARDTVCRIAG